MKYQNYIPFTSESGNHIKVSVLFQEAGLRSAKGIFLKVGFCNYEELGNNLVREGWVSGNAISIELEPLNRKSDKKLEHWINIVKSNEAEIVELFKVKNTEAILTLLKGIV